MKYLVNGEIENFEQVNQQTKISNGFNDVESAAVNEEEQAKYDDLMKVYNSKEFIEEGNNNDCEDIVPLLTNKKNCDEEQKKNCPNMCDYIKRIKEIKCNCNAFKEDCGIENDRTIMCVENANTEYQNGPYRPCVGICSTDQKCINVDNDVQLCMNEEEYNSYLTNKQQKQQQQLQLQQQQENEEFPFLVFIPTIISVCVLIAAVVFIIVFIAYSAKQSNQSGQ